ncbi:MAG: hypothetical protein AB7F35_13490 [Acetobacteraceae bacterium]
MTWTRITDADEATRLLPAWIGVRMIGLRGRFGLLLATGDVLRITTIAAVHRCSDGSMLADVLLDHAGVPDGVDLAWQSKHYLGAPVPAATLATVNVAHIVAAVEFVVAEIAELRDDAVMSADDGIDPESAALQEDPLAVARVAE